METSVKTQLTSLNTSKCDVGAESNSLHAIHHGGSIELRFKAPFTLKDSHESRLSTAIFERSFPRCEGDRKCVILEALS